MNDQQKNREANCFRRIQKLKIKLNMEVMHYSVSNTGILAKKSKCSTSSFLSNFVVILFTITSVGSVFGDARLMSEMSV